MKKRLLSLLLVTVMILACTVSAMIVGAGAEGANKIVFAVGDLTVDELGVEGATYATDIMGALSVLDENSRKHASDTTAEIHIKGNLTGGDQGNLLFAQKTIWRADGTKLPISIIGHDTASPRDAYIYLDGIGGWYTCANDYTFSNLTLPVGDQVTYFYAGSGNVRLDNVNLTSSGELTVATVADRTAMYQNAKAAAEYIAADAAGLITPDVNRLPNGDAWYKVRTSADYQATGTVLTDQNGERYVDKDLTGADGSLYGDYSHAGNTGGGQYLNACVYYEAILGLDCRENDWTPTKYVLDEDLRKMLQDAAHAAVLEVYGESHFTNPPKYDVNGDGTVNVLMMGSSSSYYMRDELVALANHVGIKLRVVHAYSSGIKVSTMWSWTDKGNGKFTVYTDEVNFTSQKKDQKTTDFVALYEWDAIVTYETGGSFNKKNLGAEGYDDTTIAKSIATVDKADELINYVYSYNSANANARYFWFTAVGAPVGAPGPSSDAEGYVFGDNNTTAAYAGWTKADLEKYSENGKVVSSVTMGQGMDFGTRINAVGYMLTAPETPYTDETAAAVEFIHLNGYDDVPDVRPVNTVGKLILDADTAAIDMTPIKRGYSPASAELHIKKGSGGDVRAYGYNVKGVTKYGDITFRWTGGSVGQIDLINGSNVTGDLTVIIDPEQGTLSTGMLRTAFNANVVTGDVTVNAKNCTFSSSVYCGGGAGGTVTNTYTNCNIAGNFFAVRDGDCGKIVNNFTNTTVGGLWCGGHWSGAKITIGPIINNINGLTLTGTGSDSAAGVYYGGSSTGGGLYDPDVPNGSVEINGETVSLGIYNNITDLKAAQTFYGGNRGGTVGNVRNDITNIECANFYGAGGASGTAGNITNNIGTATITGKFHGGSSSKTTNATKNITTEIRSITLGGNFYGGNLKSVVNGTVSNTIRGGTITGIYYGGNDSNVVKNIKNVNNTVYGGTFTGGFYGGSADGNVTGVTNTIHGGTFKTSFYGAGAAGNASSITNTIHGGTFEVNFYGGASAAGCVVSGNVTNTVYDMDLAGKYAGAGYAGTVNGNVTNSISGGTFAGSVSGGFVCASATTTMVIDGNLINTVSGPVRISGTFCGFLDCDSSGHGSPTLTGTVVNTFDKNEKGEAPAFDTSNNYCYYGTGHHGVPGGGVVNIIKAGTFYRLWEGGPFYLYGGTMGVVPEAYVPAGIETGKYSVINLVSGGTFNSNVDGRAYFWGGICSEKGGTYTGGVYTEVSGDPVFNTRFIGGHRGYGADETQPTTVKISGGTFNHNVFMTNSNLGTGLPNRNHSANGLITGGTFNKAVYGGTNGAGTVTNCTLTVQGGTFNNELVASSYPMSGVTIGGSFALTLEPTAGDITLKKAVAARNTAETIALKGGDKRILIDADATVTASSYDGKPLTICQTAGWTKDTVYLTLPTSDNNANITTTKVSGKAGSVKKVVGETETQWIGLDSTAVYAVNLILEQKIGIRLWLNKAEVDAIGSDFTLAVQRDGKSIADYTYESIAAKGEVKTQTVGGTETEFYTLRLDSVEPAAFHNPLTLSGVGVDTASMSINDILGIVIANENQSFGDGFVTLAKSLWNYGIEAYNRFSGATSSLEKQAISDPEDVKPIASFTDGEAADVKLVGRALVLREAVGIRYYLNLAEGVSLKELTFTLGETVLTDDLLNFREESGDGYNASVTLYVTASAMEKNLSLSITKGDIFVGSYSDSVASICQQYRDAQGVDAALCTAILRYVQAVPGMNQ